MEINSNNLILENGHSLKKRLIVFSSIAAVFIFWAVVFSPFIAGVLQKFAPPDDSGMNVFFRHIFIFGMPDFLFSLICLHILTRYKIFRPVSFVITKDAVFQGLIAGSALVFLVVAQWIIYGLKFQFAINYWSMSGNIFSNFYEEIIFRAFLLPLFHYLLKNTRYSVFLSSFIFAAIHARYPLFLQISIFAGGLLFAVSYIRTKTVFAPWLAHQLTDTITDTILKL